MIHPACMRFNRPVGSCSPAGAGLCVRTLTLTAAAQPTQGAAQPLTTSWCCLMGQVDAFCRLQRAGPPQLTVPHRHRVPALLAVTAQKCSVTVHVVVHRAAATALAGGADAGVLAAWVCDPVDPGDLLMVVGAGGQPVSVVDRIEYHKHQQMRLLGWREAGGRQGAAAATPC